jgi:hypothetical protein
VKYILFVCTHNAGRSQMAQAFFEKYAPPDVRAESAGQERADAPWPESGHALQEGWPRKEVRSPESSSPRAHLRVGVLRAWAEPLAQGQSRHLTPTGA